MTCERVQRWSLALIGLIMLPALIQGGFHFGGHAGHLDGLDPVDQVGLVGSLVSILILAPLSLWAGLRPRTAN